MSCYICQVRTFHRCSQCTVYVCNKCSGNITGLGIVETNYCSLLCYERKEEKEDQQNYEKHEGSESEEEESEEEESSDSESEKEESEVEQNENRNQLQHTVMSPLSIYVCMWRKTPRLNLEERNLTNICLYIKK